jgi:hypothetical protein
LLDQPKAWTIGRLWQRLGRPALSQRTLRRRVRQVACWRRRTIFGAVDLRTGRFFYQVAPKGGQRRLPWPTCLARSRSWG